MAKRGEHPHVIERAAERWGLSLTPDDVRALIQKIRAGECIEFEREGKKKRRRVLKVFVAAGDAEIPVVYHEGRGHIITVLPREAAEVQRALAKRGVTDGQYARENG